MAGPAKKLKANTLKLTELARLEDLFLTSFEDALQKGLPDDAAGLKRLRHDLESILTEANKRTKLLSIELTKIYDMVSRSPDLRTPAPLRLVPAFPRWAAVLSVLNMGLYDALEDAVRACWATPPQTMGSGARDFAGLHDLLLCCAALVRKLIWRWPGTGGGPARYRDHGR